MIIQDPRIMWFGTEDRMKWVPMPKSGADSSLEGWNSFSTGIGGGAYGKQSWDSHRVYVFEWSSASTREAALEMQAYRSGAYGRGLLYFSDPLSYDMNILPQRWAFPAIVVPSSSSHIRDLIPTEQAATTGKDFPLVAAAYQSDGTAKGLVGGDKRNSVYIPIPDGYTLYLGARYTAAGTGGVYVTPVNADKSLGTAVKLTDIGATPTNTVIDQFSDGGTNNAPNGVRLWFGWTTQSATNMVTVTGVIARLYPTGKTPPATFTTGNWVAGMGNSGCKFEGEPTLLENTGVRGGQVTYAATFREVGSWS
jgi:hypothetical protein